MEPIDSRAVLWANVQALMTHHYGGENLTRLAKDCEIGPGSATRLKQQQTSIGLELLDKLAKRFNLMSWQLLVPGMRVDAPPLLIPNEGIERALWARLLGAAQDFKDSQR